MLLTVFWRKKRAKTVSAEKWKSYECRSYLFSVSMKLQFHKTWITLTSNSKMLQIFFSCAYNTIYTFAKFLLRLQILFALAVLCTLSQILPYACKSLWRKINFIVMVYRAVCSDWGNLEREELMERAPSSSLIHSLPHSSYKPITLLNEKRVCVRQRLSGISLKIGKFSTNFNSDTICTWNKVITDNLCKFLVLWSCYTEARSCNSSIKNACFRVCY